LRYNRAVRAIRTMRGPAIAAVNGAAVGAGLLTGTGLRPDRRRTIGLLHRGLRRGPG
jgi:enoyl-CoA hydratase/carnithine racemase